MVFNVQKTWCFPLELEIGTPLITAEWKIYINLRFSVFFVFELEVRIIYQTDGWAKPVMWRIMTAVQNVFWVHKKSRTHVCCCSCRGNMSCLATNESVGVVPSSEHCHCMIAGRLNDWRQTTDSQTRHGCGSSFRNPNQPNPSMTNIPLHTITNVISQNASTQNKSTEKR